jgi:hypothetical protein
VDSLKWHFGSFTRGMAWADQKRRPNQQLQATGPSLRSAQRLNCGVRGPYSNDSAARTKQRVVARVEHPTPLLALCCRAPALHDNIDSPPDKFNAGRAEQSRQGLVRTSDLGYTPVRRSSPNRRLVAEFRGAGTPR